MLSCLHWLYLLRTGDIYGVTMCGKKHASYLVSSFLPGLSELGFQNPCAWQVLEFVMLLFVPRIAFLISWQMVCKQV